MSAAKRLLICSTIAAAMVSFISTAAERLYTVEFRDAEMKGALRLLAKMDDRNIVVPDKVEGKITASFDNVGLMDALEAVLKSTGFGFIEENGIIQVLAKEDLQAMGEDLHTATFNLQFGKAASVLPQIQSVVTSRGSVVADERTNSIYVRDTRAVIANIREMMTNLDRKDRQVLIEAKIMEASTDFIRSLGIQWGVTKSGGNINVAGLDAVGTADSGRDLILNTPASGASQTAPTSGIGLILGSFKGILTDIQISAAEEKGEISILSRPSVATVNNYPATIRSGEKFYVKTTGNFNIGGTASTTETNLQEIDTGIELKVTPQISLNDNIKLDIDASQSEADFTRAIEGVPAVMDNSATTTVMLRNGETTIIGGLFKLRDAKSVKGIPGLMKVPVLGNLFKSTTKTKTRTELLIFITPRIIENEVVTRLPHFEEPASAYNPKTLAMQAEEKMKPRPKRKNKYRN
jgi:type IV pilus assembly protein PilQ